MGRLRAKKILERGLLVGSIEQEIEYWSVQKNTLEVRSDGVQDEIDQIRHNQKVDKQRLKDLLKKKDFISRKVIVCEMHIVELGG